MKTGRVVEILTNHFGWQRKTSIEKAAKEVHEHYMKFVKWAANFCTLEVVHTSSGHQWLWIIIGYGEGALNENQVYEYWSNLPENKKGE